MKLFKRTTSAEQAEVIIQRIRAIDYELILIVTGGPKIGSAPLNAKAGDVLAMMQRQLRALRIEMEVERGIDCALAPSVSVQPRPQTPMPTCVVPRPYRRRKGK